MLVLSRSFLGLRSGGIVWLSGARLLGEELFDVDGALVGVVHRRSMGEAPLVSKFSRDPAIGLLHHFMVTVLSKVILSNSWRISSAASFDAEVDEFSSY